MFSFPRNAVDLILMLRGASIVIQSALVVFVNLALDYQLPWLAIFLVILAETFFNAISYWLTPKLTIEKSVLIYGHLVADICFLAALLYFSGGATNAFVSLLLIPIAIAAVTLPFKYTVAIALQAIAVYTVLLWLMPMHVMHGNMQGHFIGMWMNFLFSALVVLLVVSKMAKAISDNNLLIAKYREQQLKQEQIISLGVASAQVTHDLATPIASIQLITDELLEVIDDDQLPIVEDLDQQVKRCTAKLHQFRHDSQQIKAGVKVELAVDELFNKIKRSCLLHYPEIHFNFSYQQAFKVQRFIYSDSGLLPALLNIIDNGVKSAKQTEHLDVEIDFILQAESLHIQIKDFGKGFSQKALTDIGQLPANSKQGLGVAMIISNASLERLNGKILLVNHNKDNGGAQVSIYLPYVSS